MAHSISKLSEYSSVYEEVCLKLDQCMSMSKINKFDKMTLKIDKDGKGINASLNKKKEIVFTIGTVILYEKSEKEALFHLLSLQMAHLLFKEMKRPVFLITNKQRLFNMIKEVRADIEGKKLLQMDDSDIVAAFACYKNYNTLQSKEYCYNHGVLSYDERLTYVLNYDSLTEKLIETMFKNFVAVYPGKYINPKLKAEAKRKYLLKKKLSL